MTISVKIVLWVYAVAHSVPVLFMVAQRISRKTYSLIMAAVCSTDAVLDTLTGAEVVAPLMSALAVIFLILWWVSGGDDDTKRRFRTVRKKFVGIRRTAPVTS